MAPTSKGPSFAYLLLAHKEPAHVENLAGRILDLSPTAHVIVHYDVDGGEPPWHGEPSGPIHLVERSRVLWGDWSMIEATLRMVRYAVDSLEVDWVVLLSGEHRPAVMLPEWEAHIAASGKDALLPGQRLPSRLSFGPAELEQHQYLARSRHRWSLVDRPRHHVAHRSFGLLTKLSSWLRPVVSVEYIHRRNAWAIGGWRRPGPVRGWTFYRGSQWFALNRRAASAALTIDPAVANWFKRSWIPDETYLQTALRQIPGLVIADIPTTFVLNTPARPFPGWMQLSSGDLPAVRASGLPFARKVDLTARPEVVAGIDDAVDRRPDRQGGSTTAASLAPDQA